MKFLNKIDRYLLENHPLIWMTKSHYVLLASILVNVFFWLWGYFHIDLEMLQHSIGDDEFFESYAIFIYLLIAVMFLIVWAVSYFKKSAVRHLYPIGKFYFTKLLALLFVNFFLIVAPFLSFNAGMNAKTNQIAGYDEMKQELGMVNLAQTFLPVSAEMYSYKRYFELQNPGYEIIHYDSWNNQGYNTCGYNPYDHPENCDTTADGTVVQCVKLVKTEQKCDNSYSECAAGYRKVPEEYLKLYTDVNYLGYEFIDASRYVSAPTHEIFSYYYYDDYSNGSLSFNKQIRKISADRKSIKKELDHFDAFLIKYEVPHAFNSAVIAEYFAKNNGKFNYPIVEYNSNDYDFDYKYDYPLYQRNLKNTLRYFRQRSERVTIADLENSTGEGKFFMVSNSRLKCLFENAKEAYYWRSCYLETTILSFVALGLAFLFLLFSFADFITLVITVPVTGVLIIINVLICVSVYSVSREEDYLLFVPFGFSLAIIIFYIINLMKKRASRRIIHALSYLTGLISTLFFIGLIAVFDMLLKTEVYTCGYYHTEHIFLIRWFEDPGFIFTLSAIGIVLYTFTIRKLIAKPD